MNLIRWSQNPTITLLGIGNRIHLYIPLHCMQRDDELLIHPPIYCRSAKQIELTADILRRPFLSPYKETEPAIRIPQLS